jgi:hypothetical protein
MYELFCMQYLLAKNLTAHIYFHYCYLFSCNIAFKNCFYEQSSYQSLPWTNVYSELDCENVILIITIEMGDKLSNVTNNKLSLYYIVEINSYTQPFC